eukprot:TRINITY_DN1442_c1_g5_i1.p1 TRINITY_DN1442_c1_g5~~TRINITY_DN1442_c1_g5_i1.p1  ORF type:complete len:541 (+),score=49.70 TRINITY_DN1442_c1_g5_i1:106-1728(+)
MRLFSILALVLSVTTAVTSLTVGSVNGVLDIVLVLQAKEIDLGNGVKYIGRVYNGTSPGPTLNIRAGDRLKIRLINDLGPETEASSKPAPGNFRLPNTTNLHLHGLHISPLPPADDVSIRINPGEYVDYIYEIPKDHAPGTHWYHPHFHGSAALQVFLGAFGIINILGDEGDSSTLTSITIPIQYLDFMGDDSRLLSQHSIPLLQNLSFDLTTPSTAFAGDNKDYFVLGGSIAPTYNIRQCENTRLRFVFASAGSQLNMSVISTPVAEGIACEKTCTMQLLGRDGHQLRKYPRVVDGPIFIPAGGRADVLIRCAASSTVCHHALMSDGALLSHLNVVSQPICQPPIAPLSLTNRHESKYTSDLTGAVIKPRNKLEIVLIDGHGCRYKTTSPIVGTVDRWFTGNSKKDNRHVISLNEVQEIRLVDSINHPFHMHVAPFQIMSGTTPAAPGNFEYGDWADTVQFTTMVFRTRPTSFVGPQMFHCHVLSHEDQGCMAQIEIVNHAAFKVSTLNPLIPLLLLGLVTGAILMFIRYSPGSDYKRM